MVSVREALEVAGSRATIDPQQFEALADDIDRSRADFIEANVDAAIYKSFRGEAFEFFIPIEWNGSLIGTIEAVTEVKKRFEADDSGWTVVVLPKRDGEAVVAFQLIFVPVKSVALPIVEKKHELKKMPSIVTVQPTVVASKRLLVRFPTRSRPIQALEVLQKYRELAGCEFQLEVIVDEDDETMMRAEVLQRLATLDCVVTVGRHTSKVQACNGGRVTDWDVLMLASDDMMPVEEGWAVRVLEEMERAWPHLDGAIFFNDGFQKSNLCTLPIFGRRLYDQFGYIYAPEYKSLFCDREQTDMLRSLGRLTYVDAKIIEHRHHVWHRAENDELYQRNDALEAADRATFKRRKATRRAYAQFGFDSPPVWLSILICTVPARRELVERLLRDLWGQVLSRHLRIYQRSPRMFEILVDDRVEPTVGEKRQSLLEKAHGHYTAFIDDDDGVAHDYIERLYKVLVDLTAPLTADCTSLVGVITENGGRPATFKHSIKYDGWYTKDGVHYRTPNHLNAIRRDLALQVGFLPKNVGEDHDFSQRLRPLIKNEVSTGDKPLYYYWYNATNSVQSK